MKFSEGSRLMREKDTVSGGIIVLLDSNPLALEMLRKRKLEYYRKNLERIRGYEREYYWKHLDEQRKQKLEYYYRNS